MSLSRRMLTTIVLVSSLLPQLGYADDEPFSGWLMLREGYGLDANRKQPALNEQLMQLQWKQSDVAGWNVDAKVWAQRESALEPETYQRLTLREFTLTKQESNSSLALGRQIVVWGKADGFKLLDVVNPIDLREFVLGDDLRSRIPLWMANAQIYGADQQQLQLILVPQTYQDHIPPPGSEFDFSARLPPGTILQPVEVPNNRPANWTFGARWSDSNGNLDWSLVGVRALTGAPVLFPSIAPLGNLVLRQAVVKHTVLGSAADWNLGSVVARFEVALSPDEYRTQISPSGAPYVEQHLAVRSLIGLDWTVSNWLISPQLFNVHAPGSPGIANDPDGTYASLTIDRKFFYDKVDFKLFHARSLQHSDYWLSASIQYQLRDHIELFGSADYLGGESSGLFGQFGNRDRVVVGVKAYF